MTPCKGVGWGVDHSACNCLAVAQVEHTVALGFCLQGGVCVKHENSSAPLLRPEMVPSALPPDCHHLTRCT